jgi:tetratricopeptide (TPR) repeat protein
LNLLRPKRALELLDEGLKLSPDDAELLYLQGLALHRAGNHEEALARLLAALDKDQRLRHGMPYFVAGEALLELKRWDDAVDAFERYLDFNSSDVAAYTRLSRAHAGAGNGAEARKWLLDGIATWQGLPGALKRRQLGAMFGAQWARISVLREPLAIAVGLLLAALCVLGARALYPLAAGLWRTETSEDSSADVEALAEACGTQSTAPFEGVYTSTEQTPPLEIDIDKDRIKVGSEPAQEFCLTRVLSRSATALHAQALSSADDPGEDGPATVYDVRLDRGKELTSFSYAPPGHPGAAVRILLRRRE